MRIDIDIEPDIIERILEHYGYVSREVFVSYPRSGDDSNSEFGKFFVTIACKREDIQDVVSRSDLTYEDIESMELGNVVNRLFNRLLIESISATSGLLESMNA